MVVERINCEVPIAPLRWSIVYLNDRNRLTFARMKALGVAWAMQDAMYHDVRHGREPGGSLQRTKRVSDELIADQFVTGSKNNWPIYQHMGPLSCCLRDVD